MLEDNSIKVVLNLTIPTAHYPVAKKALLNGKHVYSEKPLAVSFKDGKDLVRIAQKKKLFIGCAPDTFLGGGNQKARELLDKKIIGNIKFGTAIFAFPGIQSYHPNPEPWFAKKGGGPVIVNGNPVGQSIIQGEGAGPAATTSALVSDISSIMRGNIKFPFSISEKERINLKFKDIQDRSFSAYLRFEVIDKPGVLSDITQIFSKNNVSIKRLIQNPNKSKSSSSIVIISHESKDRSLNKIIQIINKKNYVIKKSKFIRIDDV